MANSIGSRTLFAETWGRSIQVSSDGAPKYKAGGVTIDWTTVPAVGANTTTYYTGDVVANGQIAFEDNVIVKTGEKVLRYGSVVCRLVSGLFGLATDATPATPARGETFIVNETWLEEDSMSSHPGVIDGGRVFRARLLVGGAGQPSFAEVEAAMPGILYAID